MRASLLFSYKEAFMGSLFGGPKPQAPPPVPQVDNAASMRNARDRALRRGRATTILTSDNGLPNLGSTTSVSATGGG